MDFSYAFSISEEFPNGKVSTDRLKEEVLDSEITISLDFINTEGDECILYFKDELNTENSSLLDIIIANHSGEPLPQPTQPVNITGIDVNGSSNLPTRIHDFQYLDGHSVYRKGYLFTAEKYAVTRQQAKYSVNMLMQGIHFKLDGNVCTGDYLEIDIVDVDNILGYGAGLVLAKFADTIYVFPNQEFESICADAKVIYAGLYIRFSYFSYDPNEGSSSSSSSELPGVAVSIQHALRIC